MTRDHAHAHAHAHATATVAAAAPPIRALVFDVFGTVVDWRTSIAEEVSDFAARHGPALDPFAFADAWRARYMPAMQRVRTGELPWTRLDDLHRIMLDEVLAEFGPGGGASAPEPEIARLAHAWRRLRPWPDAVAGLARLKRRYIIAPLSNGNIALMTQLARFAALPWDCVLGSELVRRYKPDPQVYLSAADFLDLDPAEVMMVAAHLGDLAAARAQGLATAFVRRPLEFGPEGKPDLEPDEWVDVTAGDFAELAERLGA